MPIALEYDKRNDILIARASGKVNLADVKLAETQVISAEEYSPDVDTIWDVRTMDEQYVDREFMESVISLRQQQFQVRKAALLALVADSELKFGLSRMFEMLSSDFQQAIQVFKSTDQAVAWIIQTRK